MRDSCQYVCSCTMRKEHEWTFVIAAEPSFSIFSKADSSDGSELFALLDLVQPHSGAISERGGEDGPVAKRTRANLVSAAHPSEDEIVCQHFGDIVVVRILDVISAGIE